MGFEIDITPENKVQYFKKRRFKKQKEQEVSVIATRILHNKQDLSSLTKAIERSITRETNVRTLKTLAKNLQDFKNNRLARYDHMIENKQDRSWFYRLWGISRMYQWVMQSKMNKVTKDADIKEASRVLSQLESKKKFLEIINAEQDQRSALFLAMKEEGTSSAVRFGVLERLIHHTQDGASILGDMLLESTATRDAVKKWIDDAKDVDESRKEELKGTLRVEFTMRNSTCSGHELVCAFYWWVDPSIRGSALHEFFKGENYDTYIDKVVQFDLITAYIKNNLESEMSEDMVQSIVACLEKIPDSAIDIASMRKDDLIVLPNPNNEKTTMKAAVRLIYVNQGMSALVGERNNRLLKAFVTKGSSKNDYLSYLNYLVDQKQYLTLLYHLSEVRQGFRYHATVTSSFMSKNDFELIYEEYKKICIGETDQTK